MTERQNDYVCTGWYLTLVNAPSAATHPQLIALRDLLLLAGMKQSAAAVDNAIDLIVKETAEFELKLQRDDTQERADLWNMGRGA